MTYSIFSYLFVLLILFSFFIYYNLVILWGVDTCYFITLWVALKANKVLGRIQKAVCFILYKYLKLCNPLLLLRHFFSIFSSFKEWEQFQEQWQNQLLRGRALYSLTKFERGKQDIT